MNIIEAIEKRRSIRSFKPDTVSREVVKKVIEAAILAPSGKNTQPWSFIVVEGESRDEMVRVMETRILAAKENGGNLGSSERTLKVMAQAPLTIFIFNPLAETEGHNHRTNIVDSQSIGAAIQNMLLAAMEYGLGSLWICDVFYAYNELREWLGEKHEMIAAVSFGFPNESPKPRPRKIFEEAVRWLDGKKM